MIGVLLGGLTLRLVESMLVLIMRRVEEFDQLISHNEQRRQEVFESFATVSLDIDHHKAVSVLLARHCHR